MIRNACIHINGEQPLLADLFDMPTAVDLGLRCTNLRTLDGKRPVFVDDQYSIFFFSYEHIRFVEIPPGVARRERRSAHADRLAGRVAARRRRRPRRRAGARARDRRGLPAPHPRGLTPRPRVQDAHRPVRVREGPGATLPAVPKNLVIVESPAKARTIERYLGRRLPVLASYGHVRDLPENPGKGKFGVDVDHDFAPEYVISRRPAQAGRRHREGGQAADVVYLATDLDREGEAIAWHVAEAAHVPTDKTQPGDVQRDHRIGHPRGVRQPARDRPEPRRRAADPPDRRPPRRLHAEPAPLAQGPRRPVGRARPVRGRPPRRRARARDHAFTAREYWTIEAILETAGGERFAAELVRIDGEALDVSDERHRRRATSTAIARAAPGRHARSATRTQKRSPAPPFTTSTLQQEASRRLGFSPKRTMSVAQRLYEGVETPRGPRRPDHLHADRLDRDRRRRHGRGPRGHRRALRRAYTMPKGRVYKTKSQGRPGGPRVDPPDELPARPGLARRLPQARRAPPVPAHLAAGARLADGRQGARDHLDRAGRRPVRAARVRDARSCSTASPASTPRAATTTPPTTRTRRATPAGARRGRRDERRRGHADPALHRAAAALHRGDADQGARGARHRPAVDLCRHDLDDRRSRLRPGRGAAAPPGARSPRSSPTCSSSTSATTSTSSSRPGWRRSSTRSPAASGRGSRCCARSTARSAIASTRSAASSSAATSRPRPTDEVCSLGHPMVIRLGRNGRFLACSLYPEHKESRPLPGDEPPPQEGTGEVCPKCGEGTLVGKSGRFGPFVGCSRYPDCDYIKQEGPPPPDPLPFEVDLPQEQRRPPRAASRAAHRQRLLGMLELPEVRLHDQLRAARRPPRHRRRPDRAQGRGGHLPDLRLDDRRRARGDRARRALCRRPAEPGGDRSAGARRARRGGRRGSAPDGDRGRGADRARSAVARRPRRRTRPGRAGRRRVSGVAVDPRPLRPSHASSGRSPRATRRRTRSAPTRRRSAPTSTGSPPAAWTGGHPARADLRAYLAELGAPVAPAPRSPSASRRSARSTGGPPATGSRRATRGARSRRRACRAACRASSRSTRSSGCSPPSTRSSADATRAHRRERAWRPPSRCATGRSSRRPTRPGLRISELAGAELGVARPPARRDPGPRQGPQGADRAARPAGPARAAPPISRTAGRSCSRRRAGRRGAADRGLPEPPRRAARRPRPALPPRPAPSPGRPAGRRVARTRCATRSRRTCSTAAPTCASSRSCSATRASRRPRSTPTCRRPASARPTARRTRGRARDRRAVSATRAPWPGPGSIVSGAFLVSRILGWVRLVVIVRTVGAGRRTSTRSSPRSGIPDLIFQLVAAGALSSALIPIVSGLLATDETARAWRVVSTVINLMLIGLVVLGRRSSSSPRPAIVPSITPGFGAGATGPDGRADPDHAPQPDLPGPRARSRRAS